MSWWAAPGVKCMCVYDGKWDVSHEDADATPQFMQEYTVVLVKAFPEGIKLTLAEFPWKVYRGKGYNRPQFPVERFRPLYPLREEERALSVPPLKEGVS